MAAAERYAHQPPRARRRPPSKTNDLAREAVGCIPPSRWPVTPHQMTGRHPIGDRVRRRPVITMGGLGGAALSAQRWPFVVGSSPMRQDIWNASTRRLLGSHGATHPNLIACQPIPSASQVSAKVRSSTLRCNTSSRWGTNLIMIPMHHPTVVLNLMI